MENENLLMDISGLLKTLNYFIDTYSNFYVIDFNSKLMLNNKCLAYALIAEWNRRLIQNQNFKGSNPFKSTEFPQVNSSVGEMIHPQSFIRNE